MIVFDKPASETYFVTTHLDNPTKLSNKRVLFREFKENGHSLLKDESRKEWMWYYNDKPYAGFSGYRFFLRTAPLPASAPDGPMPDMAALSDGGVLDPNDGPTAVGRTVASPYGGNAIPDPPQHGVLEGGCAVGNLPPEGFPALTLFTIALMVAQCRRHSVKRRTTRP